MVCEQPKKIKLLICIKQQLLRDENKQGFRNPAEVSVWQRQRACNEAWIQIPFDLGLPAA